MMRKLAATVFAMSLTLIGCGSSSTSKKDAAGDANIPRDTVVVVTPDATPRIPDTGVKVPDAAIRDASVVDSVKGDVSDDDAPTMSDARDGSPAERVTDALVKLDVKRDTRVTIPDAPADTAPASGDAGLEVGLDAEVD